MTSYIGYFESSVVLPFVRILGKTQSSSFLYGVDFHQMHNAIATELGIGRIAREASVLHVPSFPL
jgi:hypothetical protein